MGNLLNPYRYADPVPDFIARYRFEGDATDDGINGLDGSEQGSPTYAAGVVHGGDYAIVLDGSADYVNVGSSLGITDGDFSMGCWFKAGTQALNNNYLLCLGRTGVSEKFAVLQCNNVGASHGTPSLRGVVDDNSTNIDVETASGTSITDSVWHHGFMVRDGNTLRLYLDGVQVDTDDITGLGDIQNATTDNLVMGASRTSTPAISNYFTGSIDDLRIYDRALSAGEVSALWNMRNDVADGLVGWWTLDDIDTPSNANDLSGNGHTLTVNGTPTSAASPLSSGESRDFDGSTEYFGGVTTSDVSFVTADSFTISGWFNSGALGSVDGIIAYDDGTNREWRVYKSSANRLAFNAWVSDSLTCSASITSPTISTSEWNHFLVEWENGEVRLYLNNVLGGTTTSVTIGASAGSPDLRIGRSGTSTYWDGKLDDIRIYNRLLSDQERYELYAAFIDPVPDYLARYGFEEMVTSGAGLHSVIFRDSSPNKLHGLAADVGLTWSTGNIGSYALDFDGTDDFAVVPDDPLLSQSSAITVCGWVKTTQSPVSATHFFGKYDTSGGRSVSIGQNGGGTGLLLILSDDGSFDSGHRKLWVGSDTVNDGSWHHVAVTFDAGTTKLYFDGTEDTSVTKTYDDAITTLFTGDADFWIGAKVSSGEPFVFFDGEIDDVRVYDRALSGAEISSVDSWDGTGADPVDDYVARYAFEEGSGGLFADSSSNGLDGLGGDNANGVEVVNGQIGSHAGDFDGTDDYVEIADNALLDHGTGDFSYSLWVKMGSVVGAAELFLSKDNYAGSGSGIYLWRNLADLRYWNGSTSSNILTSGSAGTWYHLVVSRSGTTVSLYADGALSTTISDSRTFSNAHPLRIGNSADGGYEFDGSIDDVRIYDRALSDGEVLKLYNQRLYT